MEKRIGKVKEETERGSTKGEKEGKKERAEIRIKVERIERKIEWQKRKKRRNNIVIKGLKVKSGIRREAGRK